MGPLRAYLDTSVVYPLLARDALSDRADRLMRTGQWHAIVSDLTRAEFSSVLGRRIRMKLLTLDMARQVLALFDTWLARDARAVRIETDDFALADTYLRRFDLSLRTPDALHLAASSRLDATLLTFDRGLLADAQRLALPVRTAD